MVENRWHLFFILPITVVFSLNTLTGSIIRKTNLISNASISSVTSGNSASVLSQEGFDELGIGEWLGQGIAGGDTLAEFPGGNISGFGDFTVNMEFLVPESGNLEGSWTLEGKSFWGMVIKTDAGDARTEAQMIYSADGGMSGNRSEFSLGTTQIESDITITGGITRKQHTSDPIGPFDLSVTKIYCNDAQGEWILSWNTKLEGAGYSPTFDGDWYAVRQDLEFSQDHIEELFDTTKELNDEITDIFESTSTLGGVPVIPYDTLWDLIHRAVALQNEARKLSLCDKALIGEDQYEGWMYAFTTQLAKLGTTLLANYDLAGQPMESARLFELGVFLEAGGAFGEGALFDTSAIETAMEADIAEILTSEDAENAEKVNAILAAEHLGLDLPEGFDPTTIIPEGGE